MSGLRGLRFDAVADDCAGARQSASDLAEVGPSMQARWLLLTLLCVLLLAVGQMLFKSAAAQWRIDGWSWTSVRGFLSPALIAGLVLYAATTVLWVYILRTVPLTLAYSVYALAFVIVPLLAYFFFEEPLTLKTFLGAALIVAGVIVTVR